jgi:tetratricopeptide (TPR) repeat protein
MKTFSLLTILLLTSAWMAPAAESPLVRAEALFAGRDNIDNLRQAVSLVEDHLKSDSANYDALCLLAKYTYYLSDREKDDTARLKLLETAIEAAKKAVKLHGERVEGHFWLGASYGEYAEMKGAFHTLRLIKTIRKEFETGLKIDPAYQNGDAYVALGELDIRLPRLLGGDDRHGISLMEHGLRVAPKNADLKLTLAENYARMGRKEEARRLAEDVLSIADPARTTAEQEVFRSKARRLLEKLR